MSFGLGHGRTLDPAPGVVAIGDDELPPIPDDLLGRRDAARLDPRRWFTRPDAPLEIEIGSGKGTFLLHHALANPHVNMLGIEWAREFCDYAADRVRRRGVPNVRLLRADAAEFLAWRVPDAIVRTIHAYFPDPWPKARHHRRRLVRDEVLAQVARVLEPGGELRLVTDHEGYWAWIQEHTLRWAGGNGSPFARIEFERPSSAGEGEVVGTNFERKYRREGRPFHAVALRRTGSPIAGAQHAPTPGDAA